MATGDPNVTIYILGDASQANEELSRIGSTMGTTVSSGVSGAGSLGMSLVKIMGPLAALTAGFISLRGVMSFLSDGFTLNSQMEDAKTSLATLMGLQGDVRSFGERFDSAAASVELLREKGQLAETDFSNLVDVLQQTAGTQFAAGITDAADQIDLIVATSQTLKAIGGDQANLGAQINKMLTGRLEIEDKMLNLFRGQEKELKAAVTSGTALSFVMKAMAPAIADAEHGLNNWSSLTTILKEEMDKLKQVASEPFFEAAKPALAALIEQIKSVTELIADWGPFIVSAFRFGDLGEMLGLSLTIGIMKGVNTFTTAMKAGIDVVSTLFAGMFISVLDPALWVGLLTGLAGLGGIFIGAAAILGGELLGVVGVLATNLESVFQFASQYIYNGLIMAANAFKNVLLDSVIFILDKLNAAGKFLGMDADLLNTDKLKAAKGNAEVKETRSFLDIQRENEAKGNPVSAAALAARSGGEELISASMKPLGQGVGEAADSLKKSIVDPTTAALNRENKVDIFSPKDIESAEARNAELMLKADSKVAVTPIVPTGDAADKAGGAVGDAVADSMASIGGGGGVYDAGADNPLLGEAQTQTAVLETIALNTTGLASGGLGGAGGDSTSTIAGFTGGGDSAIVGILTSSLEALRQIVINTAGGGKGGLTLSKA